MLPSFASMKPQFKSKKVSQGVKNASARPSYSLCLATAALSELSNLKTRNQEEISQLKQQLERAKEGTLVKVIHTSYSLL